MKMKSIERLFINTMLGWQPPEVLSEQNNWDGFLPSFEGTEYFKFNLDGDVVRVQAHKQLSGEWTIQSIGVNGDWTHYS